MMVIFAWLGLIATFYTTMTNVMQTFTYALAHDNENTIGFGVATILHAAAFFIFAALIGRQASRA